MESKKNQSIEQWALDNSEATGKQENMQPERFAHIPGWGVDADPDNDPTYPMKDWNGDDYKRLGYSRPDRQLQTVEKLHSNERPTVSAVIGTTVPPRGLSGELRRLAFRYSEGNWTHWLTLILADRVNSVEGILDDLSKGKVPNFLAERGWNAEWKYNRKGVLKTAGTILALTATFLILKSLTKKTKLNSHR